MAEKRTRGLNEEVKTGDFRLARPALFALVELFRLSSGPADIEDEYSLKSTKIRLEITWRQRLSS